MFDEKAIGINPLVGAGIGVGSSIINSLFQGISNRRQNKRMVDFWRMNNEYNHPSAQMARLQEAGLNPRLIYGDSVSGATGMSSGPPKPVNETPINIGNPLESYQNTQIFSLQSDNLRAQNTNLLNEAALKAANTLKAANEAGIKGVEYEKLKRTLDAQIMKIEQDAYSTYRDAEYKFNRNMVEILPTEKHELLNDARFKALMNKAKQSGVDLDNAKKTGLLRELEATLKSKQIDLYTSQAIIGMFARIMGIK